MNIGPAIVQLISNDSTLYGLLFDATDDAARVYPVTAEQASGLPFLVYHLRSATPVRTMQAATNLDVMDVDFTVFGESNTQVHTVLNALRTALDYYTGTIADVRIQRAWLTGYRDEFDAPGKMYAHTAMYTLRGRQFSSASWTFDSTQATFDSTLLTFDAA